MRKSELIKKIVDKQQGLSLQDVSVSIDCILDYLADSLSRNQRIEIRNFGNLTLHYRQARVVHNPKTGMKNTVEGKYKVHFKPGKELREVVEKKIIDS